MNKTSRWILPALGVLWLPSGLVFKDHTAHFDWGFFPLIVWCYSLPVIALASVLTFIAYVRSSQRALAVAWLAQSLGYLMFSSALWLDWPPGMLSI